MGILELPSEIRQCILLWTICSPVTPPACPSVSQRGRFRQASGNWALPPQNPALPLLLVSKRFNEDVNAILPQVPTNYHVDIMYVKNCGFWTTWTIPVLPPTRYIESVDATFRIFEPTDDLEKRFRDSLSFRFGDGGPAGVVWSLFYLLVGVLHDGPGFLSKKTLQRTNVKLPYVVKRFVINTLPPSDASSHKSIVFTDKECEGKLPRIQSAHLLNNASMAPEERLAEYMTGHLGYGLNLDYHTMSYCQIFYENVAEEIVFLVDGAPYRRWDMEKMAEEHSIEYWGETPELIGKRKDRYQKWRAWLKERRQRMKENLDIDDNCPVEYVM